MRHLPPLAALALFLMLITPALAGTIHVMGTNVTNAQSNVSKDSTNASVTITAWSIGTGTKTIQVKGYNASESLMFVLYNFTASMVIERKDNSTSKNAYQANSTGAITFNTTQSAGNITYSLTPAVNVGGYNYTWAWFLNLFIPNSSIPLTAVNISKMTQVRAYNSSDQVNLSNGVATLINFNTESFDVLNEFANSRYTATYSGYRDVTIQAALSTVSASTAYSLFLYKNGAEYSRTQFTTPASYTNNTYLQKHDLVNMTAGDYLEGYIQSNDAGSTTDLDASTLTTYITVSGAAN